MPELRIGKDLCSLLTVSNPHKHQNNRYHRVFDSLVAVVLCSRKLSSVGSGS
ncbi:hypothetical protein HMPREF9141_0073 [Prevotella multiformis DSM 16608]|uniref:Uncharacterized protein n=1 Tax=Prevotella multiformis DSM 16608 TaxID=888743 RepID=F0F3A7_9BACT|nr:hypothetical protein HMPREF9141_0073 [Prevotella multiformis DSM 16608]